MFQSVDSIKEIPEIFYDFITRKPIESCICCERALLTGETPYFIEKAIKRDDVILEYAICLECSKKKEQSMSVESRERISAWAESRVDILERGKDLAETVGFDFEAWIDRCIFTDKPRAEMEQYTIFGAFFADRIMMGFGPYVISPEAQSEMMNLLSAKTKSDMDDFIGDNFGLPPELKKLIRDLDFITV